MCRVGGLKSPSNYTLKRGTCGGYYCLFLEKESGDCPSLKWALIARHPLKLNELVQFKEKTQKFYEIYESRFTDVYFTKGKEKTARLEARSYTTWK